MTGGFVLPTRQLDKVEQHLSRLYDKTGATCSLLIDISGQLISYKGTAEGVDLAGLAALGADRDSFPRDRMAELVEKLISEIADEGKRASFQQTMLEAIESLR